MTNTLPDIKDYQDLFHCQRPRCSHPMSLSERAAQFSPYATLTGHQDIISADEDLAEQSLDHEHRIIADDES